MTAAGLERSGAGEAAVDRCGVELGGVDAAGVDGLGSNVDPRGGWPPKVLPLHMDRLLIGGASVAAAGRGGGAGAASFEVGLRRDCRALAVAFALNSAGGWRWMPPVEFTLTAVASTGGLGGR